jgi:hypothetical protein
MDAPPRVLEQVVGPSELTGRYSYRCAGVLVLLCRVENRGRSYVCSRPNRTTIIEQSRVKDTPVHVIRADNTPVDRDITSLRVYFWNAGKKPMLASEVLEPILFVLPDDVEILDHRVTKASRPHITGVTVRRADRGNALALDFRVLEQNEGVGLQLVVAGNPGTPVRATGVVLGGPRVTDTQGSIRNHYWRLFIKAMWPNLALTGALPPFRPRARTGPSSRTTPPRFALCALTVWMRHHG